MLKLLKTTNEKKIVKEVKEKKTYYSQRNKEKNDRRFLIRNHKSQKVMEEHLWSAERGESCQPKILYPVKKSFKYKGNENFFRYKKMLKAFITNRLELQEILNLQVEGIWYETKTWIHKSKWRALDMAKMNGLWKSIHLTPF